MRFPAHDVIPAAAFTAHCLSLSPVEICKGTAIPGNDVHNARVKHENIKHGGKSEGEQCPHCNIVALLNFPRTMRYIRIRGTSKWYLLYRPPPAVVRVLPPSSFFPSSLESHVLRRTSRSVRGRHHRASSARLLIPRDRLLKWEEQPGDIVTVNNGVYAKREGLVVGSHIDYAVCEIRICLRVWMLRQSRLLP